MCVCGEGRGAGSGDGGGGGGGVVVGVGMERGYARRLHGYGSNIKAGLNSLSCKRRAQPIGRLLARDFLSSTNCGDASLPRSARHCKYRKSLFCFPPATRHTCRPGKFSE